MFERLRWEPDRALLDDLVLRLEPSDEAAWQGDSDYFRFYKNRQLVEQFDHFWSTTSFRPRHMLEVGIWDGGSTAFWFELLRPERLAAVDLQDREDSAYFRRWISARGLAGRVTTHWRTDQADASALRAIVEKELGGRLDLVIDDGSHLETPTRASFEALFPLLPAGGLYLIEDWAWEHWPEFQAPDHFWAGEEGLGALVADLVAAAGSSKTLLRRVAVYEGFVAVERGDGAPDLESFRLADHVRRRPWRPRAARLATASRSAEPADVKLMAFYLPQYHPIPENDRWWGKGYTEWTRVARARPRFDGHYQPHVPDRLGFYDLRHPGTLARQAELARAHGVHGFCYYYYWFGTKTLLDRPLREMLASGSPDLPFCICWANENWTRRWDGAERELLIEQRYSPELDAAFIEDLLPYFRDPRYLRVGGAPVLLVYRPTAIPDPCATVQRWRQAARTHGLLDLHLVAAQTFGLVDPRPLAFDAAVEFPPHGEDLPVNACAVEKLAPDFAGAVVSFGAVARRRLALPQPPFPLYRTAMPGWDNTPRLGRLATVFHGADPATYESWLSGLVASARRTPEREPLVFVNAWNEWGEGAHLEPDRRFGMAYLEATRRALGA